MAEPIKIDLGDEIVTIIPRPGQSAIEAQHEAAQQDPKIAAFLGTTKEEISRKDLERGIAERFPAPQGPSPAQQMLRGGISAAATLPAFVTPGGILPKLAVEMVGPMLAETGMQQTGLAPKSGADIAMAGITPLATRGALALPGVLRGGGRAAMNFIAPQATRETGIETFKRSGLQNPSAAFFFSEARRQGPIPTRSIVSVLDDAITKEGQMATPNKGAMKILGNLKDKLFNAPTTKTVKGNFTEFTQQIPGKLKTAVSYDDMIDEVQRLRQEAQAHFKRGNHVTGVTLNKARAQILDAMDEISPAIKKANALYRREQAMQAIGKEMRKTNPGNAVRNLFEQDELVAGSFFPKGGREQALEAIRRGEWGKVPQLEQITDMADRIGRAGTGITMGAFNRFLMAVFEPAAEGLQEPLGKALLRMLMQNPRQPLVSRTGASAAAQFGRGAFGRIEEEE